MRAYIYGKEVKILDFYHAKMHGTRYCLAIDNDGEVYRVPESCIEIW